MKKFEGILFCTDLDGTLYSNDTTVSRRNLDAIEYFKAEGGLFTFITGRPPMISQEICRAVHPNAPFGCCNGGAIFDPVADRYLWQKPLSREAFTLLDLVSERMPDMGIQVNTEREIIFSRDNAGMEWFRSITHIEKLERPYREIRETILKVVFAHLDSDRIDTLAELLASHPLASQFGFVKATPEVYEILPPGVSKGGVLEKMADLLGIAPERTVAVGDYYNDVPMLKTAGIGFAVANANDAAKAAADHITVSNEEGAIAAIVEGLDRGIYTL